MNMLIEFIGGPLCGAKMEVAVEVGVIQFDGDDELIRYVLRWDSEYNRPALTVDGFMAFDFAGRFNEADSSLTHQRR